jgi:DNA-binding response OmpR family regulator
MKLPTAGCSSLDGPPGKACDESKMRSVAKSALAGRRILIVEDEFFLADDLKQILREQHVHVLGPVPTMSEALRVMNDSDPIDGAVLDVNLGGKPVFPISAALMERNIPFLFTTGYGSAQIPAMFSGAPRLEKPFIPSALISALEAIMPAVEP